jgi:glycosyltransferase involved in cell wall biosynthesis
MRILYCNKYNFSFSGTEICLFDLMDLMRAHGHEVALFSMADPRGESTVYDKHFLPAIDFKDAGNSLITKLKHAAHMLHSWDARRRLRKVIADFRPDIAHVRNIYHHLSPSILWELKAQAIPVVYHLNDFKLICPSYNMVSHGKICERCHDGRFWHVVSEACCHGGRAPALVLAAEAYAHKWMRTYQECVDRFVVPSQFMKDKLIDNHWDENKIQVVPHFQRLPAQIPPSIAAEMPILYFGRLSREKGIDDLLRAMQHLPQTHLIVAGDGPQRLELKSLSRALRLHNVEFVGQLSRPALDEAISESCLTVFPSRAYEAMGKSILESYAWKRPVIASDLGSRREVVHANKTGLLFPPGDVTQMAHAISFVACNPGLAAQMGAAGHEILRQRHSPDDHYSRMLSIYEQLASRSSQAVQAHDVPTQSPLRIAFIGGRGVLSKYSGVETYYEQVGSRLAQRGRHVVAYCRDYFTPRVREHNGIRLVRLPTIRSKHLDTLAHTLLSTVHAMFSRCDIVHYHCLGPALFSFLPRLVGKKTVVTVQGLDWQRCKWQKLAASVLRIGERGSVRLPNATIVVSRTLQHYYRERYGIEPAYVPNGTILRQRRGPSQLLNWGLEPDGYILFVGRLSPEKNCHLLIEAHSRIENAPPLVMAGDSGFADTYGTKLRAQADARVKFLGWVSGDAFEELLTNAMLFVLPSSVEGLSLSLLDAMATGVCVLVSDIPENLEVADGAGFSFRNGDSSHLERMLRMLIVNPQLRQATVDKARARVRERYAWDHITKQVEDIYLALLPERKTQTSEIPEQQEIKSYRHAA